MERGEFTHYAPDESLKSISVRSFAEDPDGYIYAATTSGIIIIDSDMNHTLIKDQSIAGAYFEDLQVGADGLIYGITVNGDICTLRNRKPFQFFSREKIGSSLLSPYFLMTSTPVKSGLECRARRYCMANWVTAT